MTKKPDIPAPAPALPKARLTYTKALCDRVKELGAEGYGLSDTLAALKISIYSHNEWLQRYTDYAMAWESHTSLCRAFYKELDSRKARMVGGRANTIYTFEIAEDIYKLDDYSLSDAELAALLGVSKRTLQKWVDENEEFRDAMEWYATQAEAYWMQLGGKYAFMPSKASQPRLYTFQMANRFGMVEQLKVDHHASAEALTKPRVQINAVKPETTSPTS